MAAALRYADAPLAVKKSLCRCLLCNFGMARSVDPAADGLAAILVRSAACPGDVPVFGARGTRSATDAAFINGGLITVLGQDDACSHVLTHVGCVLIPAVLALAHEEKSLSGEVLDELLVGYELTTRLAEHLGGGSPGHDSRSTPVFGVVSAAVAYARVLGLDTPRTAHALSIATNFAAGLMRTRADGSDEWRLQIARASQGVAMTALLARGALNGVHRSLEVRSGFATAYSGAALRLDLSGWRVPAIAFKPFLGCTINQAAVSCLVQLLRENRFDSGLGGERRGADASGRCGLPGRECLWIICIAGCSDRERALHAGREASRGPAGCTVFRWIGPQHMAWKSLVRRTKVLKGLQCRQKSEERKPPSER